MNRSAFSVCDTQYTTVSRKLPTMTAMATIIARLTDSAATEMPTRGIAPDRLLAASSPLTPASRGSRRRATRTAANSTTGTRPAAPNTSATADA
jgi:hypothetical protein